MTEEQIRSLLRKMKDEPVPPDSRVRVRAVVADRIHAASWPSAFRWRWATAIVILALSGLAVVFLLRRPSAWVSHPPAPAVSARQSDVPLQTVSPLGIAASPPKRVLRRAKHQVRSTSQPAQDVREAPAAHDGVLIRIETADPDVVIVLAGD
jgi:hypothetical protein